MPRFLCYLFNYETDIYPGYSPSFCNGVHGTVYQDSGKGTLV